jgi:hypothetical protein
MTLNSNSLLHSQWEIRPAGKADLQVVAAWIEATADGRNIDIPILASTLSSMLETHGMDDRIQHIVGTRDGELMFYFNGYLKDRFGRLSRKLHKKKDYCLWLIANSRHPDFTHLSAEIWLHALTFVFQNVVIGRVITEMDRSATDYIEGMQRVGFRKMNNDEAERSLLVWYACDKLDFSYASL